jgi:hypothetical protein
MYIRDGHHRLTRIAEDGGSMADVDMIDFDNVDTSTPLLDYREPTQAQRAAARAENDALFADLFGDMSESDMAAMLSANASQSGGLLGAGLSEAQRQARDILDMRAAGNARSVTDDMMARADDQYMFDNTPLPMDEASRLARGRAAGFDTSRPYIHGTAADFPAFKDDVWASEGNQLPAEYSSARRNMTGGDETFYPLAMRAGNAFEADRLPNTVTVGDFVNEGLEQSPRMADGTLDTARVSSNIDAIRAAARQEESGPNYGRNNFWNYPSELFGEGGAASIGNVMDDLGFDSYRMIEGGEQTLGVRRPNDARSRFARFDPEFSHLSNLSAANASPTAGLLASGAQEQDKPLPFMEMLRGLLR